MPWNAGWTRKTRKTGARSEKEKFWTNGIFPGYMA